MRNYDEIIEGLNCCSQDGMCDICPYNTSAHCYPNCLKQLCSNAENIIQQQNNFIKHLQKICDNYFMEILEDD